MSAENAAEQIAVALSFSGLDITLEPEEDMRSGGYFFDVDVDGKAYTVLVTELS